MPCHFAHGTKILPDLALDQAALSEMGREELTQLVSANQIVFEKCRDALLHNGVSQEQLDRAFAMIRLFGS